MQLLLLYRGHSGWLCYAIPEDAENREATRAWLAFGAGDSDIAVAMTQLPTARVASHELKSGAPQGLRTKHR